MMWAMDFAALLDATGKYGVPLVITVIVLVFGVRIAYVKFNKWKKRQEKEQEAVGHSSGPHPAKPAVPDTESYSRKLDLTDHYFFSTVQTAVGVTVPTMRCGCDTRSDLLRAMMRLYLECWGDVIQKFCEEIAKDRTFDSRAPQHGTKMEAMVNDLIISVFENYHTAWAVDGVPQAAVVAFDRWHNHIAEAIVENAKRVAASGFYATNRDRLVAVLAQVAAVLTIVVREGKYVLRRMNGTLDGLQYKGRLIQGIDDPHGEEIGTDGVLPEPPKPKPYRRTRSRVDIPVEERSTRRTEQWSPADDGDK